MIAEQMKGFVKNSSAIRAMFEEGKKMAAEDDVFHILLRTKRRIDDLLRR